MLFASLRVFSFSCTIIVVFARPGAVYDSGDRSASLESIDYPYDDDVILMSSLQEELDRITDSLAVNEGIASTRDVFEEAAGQAGRRGDDARRSRSQTKTKRAHARYEDVCVEVQSSQLVATANSTHNDVLELQHPVKPFLCSVEHAPCRGVDEQRFASRCETRYTMQLTSARAIGTKDPFELKFIRMPSHCVCTISPR